MNSSTPPLSPNSSLRTATNKARHDSGFIRRKRASSSKTIDAIMLTEEEEREEIDDKWKNRNPKRLLRAVRQDCVFEEADGANSNETSSRSHQHALMRQQSDEDDDIVEQGFGTFTCLRESTVCKWTYFLLHDIIFSPPIVILVCLMLVIFYCLSYIDAIGIANDGIDSTITSKLAQVAKLLPGQQTATRVTKNLGSLWDSLVGILPEQLQDPVKLLSPGIVATTAFSFVYKHLYTPFMDELKFSDAGFGNRVSISINTLAENDHTSRSSSTPTEDRAYRQQLIMRTVKEMSLEELLPNASAYKLMQRAGADVQATEDGPIVALYENGKVPCNGWFHRCCKMRRWCRKLCCLKKETPPGQRGGFCCGLLPRYNCLFCGTVKHHYLYCDPILRFHACDASLKKKISDQIVNQLSECTTGSHFLGYEMGLPYLTVDYVWALTYEQPIKLENHRTAQDSRNRKYRILLARKEMVEFANNQDPWDVFTMGDSNSNEYCDRRWVHLRTMGQIFKVQRQLKRGDDVDGIHDEKDRKASLDWLETFFVGEVKVVAPKPINADGMIVRRAWEKEHAWEAEHKKWMEVDGGRDESAQTLSRQASRTSIRVPSESVSSSSSSRRRGSVLDGMRRSKTE